VTSLGFLEAELLVGEAGGGVKLSRVMHRSPHPRDFVPSRLSAVFHLLLHSTPFSFPAEAYDLDASRSSTATLVQVNGTPLQSAIVA